MSDVQWNMRNVWLNRLSSELKRRTFGHVSHVAVEATDDDSVIVSGDAHSYYGVQLTLLGIQHCREDCCPFTHTRVLLEVGGRSLSLCMPPRSERRLQQVSANVDNRRPQLTLAGPP